MAYSVLQTGKENKRMLWCSKKQKAILTGSEQEMYDFKDFLESIEQGIDNIKNFVKLRTKYVAMLVAGGHSKKEANDFLKNEMPFLYESK